MSTAAPRRVEIAPGVFSLAGTEHSIRLLLRARAQAAAEIASIDARLLPLRKQYAAERGEIMPPSIERLRRELLP